MARKRTRDYVPHATRNKWPMEPIEVRCDYCGGIAKPITGDKLYPNRPDLHSKAAYHCDPCKASVGCHNGTWQPLGRLANPELRKAKQAAHAAFDPLWQAKMRQGARKMDAREAGYAWLAEQLGLTREDCHIGMMDVAMCKRVVEVCRPFLQRMEEARRG